MLHEREIFDCLRQNLKSAASQCDRVAREPRSGEAYIKLRRSLKLAEGACRQAACYREDTRWLNPGIMLEKAHQIARAWLHRPTVESKKLFAGLADALRQMEKDLDRLENMASKHRGIILPEHMHLERPSNPLTRIKNLPRMPSGLVHPSFA